MSGFGVFVNVIMYAIALVFVVLKGGWWWAAFAVLIFFDVSSVWLKKKADAAKHAQEVAELRREIQESRQPYAPPAAAPAPDPAPPARTKKANLPRTADGCVIAYRYDDVSFDVIRTGAAYASNGKPVDLRAEGDDVILSQEGHDIGSMQDTRIRGMVHDWNKSGDPVRAALVAYPFRGSTGVFAIAFYRDELAHYRKNKSAFTARIGAPDESLLHEDSVGIPLEVYRDAERERYVLTADGLDAGMLPKSAVERLQSQDREPEDARYFLESVREDEESGKTVCTVLVV